MGMEMEYTLGGRKVSQRDFFRGIEQQIVDDAVDEVQQRIQRTRCPIHGQYAAATPKGRRGDTLQFAITGCCDRLVEAAQRAV